MRCSLLVGFVTALVSAQQASSQGYDVNCPMGLSRNFMHYQPVSHAGYEWDSEWRATSSVRPLPSKSWYHAVPYREIVSIDGRAKWTSAEILVHCWVYRNMYLTVVHYDPIRYSGSVRSIVQACSGGGGEIETSISVDLPSGIQPVTSITYEPYNPYDPGGCDGTGGGGGPGDGNGGTGDPDAGETFPEQCGSLGGKLHYDYLCLEQWNPESGDYETLWCGTAAICET